MVKKISNSCYWVYTPRIAAGIIALFLLLVGYTDAATPIGSCTKISSPGGYVLNTSINSNSSTSCININSSDIIFDGAGYTINGNKRGNGVYVSATGSGTNLTNVTIKNLRITNWSKGIYYIRIINGSINNNTANSNDYGISLEYSNNNTLSGNTADSNNYSIKLFYSNNNKLFDNTNSNNYIGIYIYYSNNNILSRNTALNNTNGGIELYQSSNNMLINNNFSSNMDNGIYLDHSYNNTLNGNIASYNYGRNGRGIYLINSSYNMLSGNIIKMNNLAGIDFSITYPSYNNIIYNNIFNNTINISLLWGKSTSRWNTTKNLSRNIVRGPYLGGNFWGSPNGKGFSQICSDSNKDGICESSFSLNSNNTDYLPLISYMKDGILSITDYNRQILENASNNAWYYDWDPTMRPRMDDLALLNWSYGQTLDAAYERPVIVTYRFNITKVFTQHADNDGNNWGRSDSTIKALSKDNTSTSDWIKGSRVIDGGVTKGTVIATFLDKEAFKGHAAIFNNYTYTNGSIDGFEVWDQNWLNYSTDEGFSTVGKHTLKPLGYDTRNATNYYVVLVPVPESSIGLRSLIE